VEQLADFHLPETWDDQAAVQHYVQGVARRIAVKDHHAETCKRELEILWSDFFKPEHLEQFPGLHETIWQALKLASKNKQELNHQAALDLVKAVDTIAEHFYAIKGVPERFKAYQELTDHLF
ncbi:hypothetical protein HY523_02425, partial [Candidatus Berkelbacteria bacterium]|nr:hypothetical protein [Candidatus Berkelbacteria bacterium]